MTDPITPERVTPHRPVMADPLLVAGHVCRECGRAGDDPEVHPPERVTLTEGELEEWRPIWEKLANAGPTEHEAKTWVLSIYSGRLYDRLRAASEREAQIRARVDEWERRGRANFCGGAHSWNHVAELRALLDGDEAAPSSSNPGLELEQGSGT